MNQKYISDLTEEQTTVFYNECMEKARVYAKNWWDERKHRLSQDESYLISNPWVNLWKSFADGIATEQDIATSLRERRVLDAHRDYKAPQTGVIPKSECAKGRRTKR